MFPRVFRGTLLTLLWMLIPMVAVGDHVGDPCLATVTSQGGTLLVCPQGDGPTLASIDATIHVRLIDAGNYPVVGIPAKDFWLWTVDGTSLLCNGSRSSGADQATDENGETTISGGVAAGGYWGGGTYVVAQGIVLRYFGCDEPLAIVMVSPDIDGDLDVDLSDFARFGTLFPPHAYDPRADLNGDAVIDVADLARFAVHAGHGCGG